MYEHRQLTGSIDGSLLRYQKYNGVDHLVAPVIALFGDVVVCPSNGLGAEYVPSEVLSLVPEAWNGRPVVYNHPKNDNGSANDPTILDMMCFGSLFNTRFDINDNKLKSEVWLDTTKADQVGANEIISHCSDGKTVEVSVGAFVLLKKESGVANGQPYEYIWKGVIPDHLAMLESGSIGACSVEMGCGAPRLMTMEGGKDVNEADKTKVNKGESAALAGSRTQSAFMRGLQRMFSWTFRGNELSDVELRWQLEDLLRNVEPGFDWIVKIWPESLRVVYRCYTEKQVHTYQRTYTLENDVAKLNDDRVEGEMSEEFKPLAGGDDTPSTNSTVTQAASCGCQNLKNESGSKKEIVIVANPIVDRLIAKKLVAESARAKIEALEQAHIVALAASLEGGGETDPDKKDEKKDDDKKVTATSPQASTEQTATPPVTPATPSSPTTLSAEQFMALAPESIRQLVKRAEIEESNRRAHYISQLSKAQTHLKTDQLQSRTTDQLEEMIALLGLTNPTPVTVDYSGQAIGIPSATSSNLSTYKAPDPWGIVKPTSKEAN
jgi:hypothetical protein